MIVDTSALIAIINEEPDAGRFERALVDNVSRMSVASWLEASLVASGLGRSALRDLDALVDALEIELVPVTREQAVAARQAHHRYGRGSGSPAKLNYGDCFAYALADIERDTLLFKGEDFTHTDILPAI